jgi:hypothetical protein
MELNEMSEFQNDRVHPRRYASDVLIYFVTKNIVARLTFFIYPHHLFVVKF